MDSSTTPPAGFYPDPEDSSRERWWGGTQWTEHTRIPVPQAGEPPTPDAAKNVLETPRGQAVFRIVFGVFWVAVTLYMAFAVAPPGSGSSLPLTVFMWAFPLFGVGVLVSGVRQLR